MYHHSVTRGSEPAAERKKPTSHRDHSSDNIRFLLIFSVVFAHLLEHAAPFHGSGFLYQVIYSFHMPAFLFLFGYHVSYSPKRIVFRWVIPYLVCQCLYIFFVQYILKTALPLQFTTPYWLLWYMLACIFYQLLIPFYDMMQKSGQFLALLAVLAIALLAGFDDSIGYYISLSRILVFQPWFLLGFYCRKNSVLEHPSLRQKKSILLHLISTGLVCLSVLFLYKKPFPNQLLYGSYSYASINCTLWMRTVTILIAFIWILFLFVTIKPHLDRVFPCVTRIGRHTLPIFLLHGFIVKALPVFAPEWLNAPWKIVLLTCAILLLAGNRLAKQLIDCICLCWLEKYAAWSIK